MATKSFQTNFRFTAKTAGALATAIQRSKRVDIKQTQSVKHYASNDIAKTGKFDSFFGQPSEGKDVN